MTLERENRSQAERRFQEGTVEGSFGAGWLKYKVDNPGVIPVKEYEEIYDNSHIMKVVPRNVSPF